MRPSNSNSMSIIVNIIKSIKQLWMINIHPFFQRWRASLMLCSTILDSQNHITNWNTRKVGLIMFLSIARSLSLFLTSKVRLLRFTEANPVNFFPSSTDRILELLNTVIYIKNENRRHLQAFISKLRFSMCECVMRLLLCWTCQAEIFGEYWISWLDFFFAIWNCVINVYRCHWPFWSRMCVSFTPIGGSHFTCVIFLWYRAQTELNWNCITVNDI